MSKAAIGENGTEVGSKSYFRELNHGTLIEGYLPEQSGYDYRAALENLAEAALEIITEVYYDLQTHAGVLRFIPSERRTKLAGLISTMSDLCVLAERNAGQADECLSMLMLSEMTSVVHSTAADDELDRAAELIQIGGSSGLDAFSRESVVREAVQWGIDFAIGADETKRFFLEELMAGRTEAFLKEAWEKFNFVRNPGEFGGGNGYEFCSDSYTTELEGRLFAENMFSTYMQEKYEQQIKEELQGILRQIETDVLTAKAEKDYLTDERGAALKEAVFNMERCGVLPAFGLGAQIRELCWYTPLNHDKIMKLQQYLNQMGVGEARKEDGVYGENTQGAWREFLSRLEHGAVPTLAWIDPLQSQMTGIKIGATKAGAEAGLFNALVIGEYPFIRFDPPHIGSSGTPRYGWFRGERIPIDYNHVNIGELPQSPALYQQAKQQFNHFELTDDAYDVLKNLKSAGKVIRVAGRVLLVAGTALDALELGTAMYEDLNDADGKLGKTTASTTAGIVGSWGGAVLGAKGGAMAGAAIGTAVFPGIGTAVGGAVLGLAGGIAGSFGGDAFARWIVDITCVGD